ncbi:MAG: hypothetical protein AAF660_12290 [Pseudomonadota bacterium]
MKTLILILGLALLAGCSSQKIDTSNAEIMNQTMIFVWDQQNPCKLSCIRVGGSRTCDTQPPGDPCTMAGDDRFPTACVNPGDVVLLGSVPADADFRILFRPTKARGKKIQGSGTLVRTKADTPLAKYKFTAIRELRQCLQYPNDPHIRVTSTQITRTMTGPNQPQAPEPAPVPDPEVDPGTN